MDIRFKIYQKNKESYFTKYPRNREISAIEDLSRMVNENHFEKIDIYNDTKLIATIYG